MALENASSIAAPHSSKIVINAVRIRTNYQPPKFIALSANEDTAVSEISTGDAGLREPAGGKIAGS